MIDPGLARELQDKACTRYPEQSKKDRDAAGLLVISYPKSGRTWHRVMIGVYLTKHLDLPVKRAFQMGGLCRTAGIGNIIYSHNGANFGDCLPPDHELVASPDLWHGKRVILLVRDPKDVVVSSYFHASYRDGLFNGPISEFVRDPRLGIEKILTAYNRWHENQQFAEEVDVLHYEAMHSEAEDSLIRSLRMAGIEQPDAQLVAETIEICRFENMQQQEKENFYNHFRLSTTVSDPRAQKVREGVVGGYRKHLSKDDIAFIDQEVARLGNPFANPDDDRDERSGMLATLWRTLRKAP